MKKNFLLNIIMFFTAVAGYAQTTRTNLAPTAQKLILALKENHQELKFIGLHVSPPTGDSTNVIIASTIPEKIGNKSSPGDMEVVNRGVLRLKTQTPAKTYEVCLPISTASKEPLGMVVIQISFDNARSIVDALQKGLLIRDDLQNHIADKATLFSQN